MFLFVDTETSDLIKKFVPLDDPSQPWIVSLAAELMNEKGEITDSINVRIRADGRKIREGAESVHGISTREASRGGVPEIAALGVLVWLARQARYVINFGVNFDKDAVTSVLMRRKKEVDIWVRPGLQFVDLMRAVAPACKIPSTHEHGGYKWPSLDEACEILLGIPPRQGGHVARDDMERAKKVFIYAREHRLLELM